MDTAPRSAPALALAGLAALLASSCCVLPLVLALLGISGAWISRLRVLEPYSPALIALSIGALALAGWRLFRPLSQAEACAPTDLACRVVRPTARRWFWFVALLALVPLLAPLVAPWFY